jgi:tetratricopeptide (TPR) repeat protein
MRKIVTLFLLGCLFTGSSTLGHASVDYTRDNGRPWSVQLQTDEQEKMQALIKQARDLLTRGKQTEALALCDQALDIAQRLNDKPGTIAALRVKGDIARARGDNKQALEHYERFEAG